MEKVIDEFSPEMDAEQILKSSLVDSMRLISRAAKGEKVETQSLNAAKMIAKKYGFLQEETSVKESEYIKMSNEELCERSLAAVVSLMRERGRGDLAKILTNAIEKLKRPFIEIAEEQ